MKLWGHKLNSKRRSFANVCKWHNIWLLFPVSLTSRDVEGEQCCMIYFGILLWVITNTITLWCKQPKSLERGKVLTKKIPAGIQAVRLRTGSWNKKHTEKLQLTSLKIQVRNLEVATSWDIISKCKTQETATYSLKKWKHSWKIKLGWKNRSITTFLEVWVKNRH